MQEPLAQFATRRTRLPLAAVEDSHHLCGPPRRSRDSMPAGRRHARAHNRTTNCCWAAYLRVLRRYLDYGEQVPYAERLDVYEASTEDGLRTAD